MMWLYARYLAVRRVGWFVSSRAGGWPVPAAWQGWSALGLFVTVILASEWLHGEGAMLVRIGAAIGYLGLSVIACA